VVIPWPFRGHSVAIPWYFRGHSVVIVMNETPPPRLARRLLARWLPADTREFVLGDLDEEFTRDLVPLRGARGARRL
jgi:hypothetical protein